MFFTHVADEDTWNRIVRQLPGHGIHQAWSWGELRTGPQRAVRRYALLRNGQPRAAASVELSRIARVPWRIAYAPRGPLWVEEADLAEFIARLAPNLRRSGVLYLKVDPGGPVERAAALRQVGFIPIPRKDQPCGGILPAMSARLAFDRPQSNRGSVPDAWPHMSDGVRITRETSEDALDALYPWLEHGAHGPGPSRVLRSMASSWLWRGEGSILLAQHDGKCIGGALCTYFGSEALGHFVAENPDQRPAAAYALYAAGLKEALARGCRYFDFGGIRGAADDPLLHLTRPFGAGPFQHAGEWNLPLRPLLYSGLSALSRGALPRRS